MTKSGNKSKPTPADRLHTILRGTRGEESPIDRLPKAKPLAEEPAYETAPVQTPPPPTVTITDTVKPSLQFLPAFWTIASLISMTVNILLLAVLVGAMRGLDISGFGQMGTGLVGGLYSNFEKMDTAHIKTTIPIQSSIPLNMSIPVQTTTNISLANAVEIPNAHVKISTGTFNIDSAADVTLPAGTSLNVVLNFNVPVQSSVPIALNVPVDIPLSSTELHPAITGLESTIKPLYCILSPGAISISNVPVCR